MHCDYRDALFVTYAWVGKATDASSQRRENVGHTQGLPGAAGRKGLGGQRRAAGGMGWAESNRLGPAARTAGTQTPATH